MKTIERNPLVYAPSRDGEAAGLAAYIDQQLAAIAAAPVGLTEEQARATPCRSALSIGGLVKHALRGVRGALDRLANGPVSGYGAEAVRGHADSFVVGESETVSGLLDELAAARAQLLAAIAAADPDAEEVEAPAPWFGRTVGSPIHRRYFLAHLLEEFARHAGHADIIREQIDGISIAALVMTADGVPANAYFTPYVPAPGTIGA